MPFILPDKPDYHALRISARDGRDHGLGVGKKSGIAALFFELVPIFVKIRRIQKSLKISCEGTESLAASAGQFIFENSGQNNSEDYSPETNSFG